MLILIRAVLIMTLLRHPPGGTWDVRLENRSFRKYTLRLTSGTGEALEQRGTLALSISARRTN